MPTKLPTKVQKEADAADELYNQMYGPNKDNPQNDNAGGSEVAETTQPAEGDIKMAHEAADTKPPVAPDPQAAPAAPTAPDTTAAPQGADVGKPIDYEQQWKTLQGMYGSANRTIAELTAEVAQLKSQAQPSSAAGAPPQAAAPTVEQRAYSTEDDIAGYGDALDVMKRAAMEVVDPVIQRLERTEQLLSQMQEQVVPKVDNLSQMQTQTAEEAFFERLTQRIPDWTDIQATDEFQNWLAQADPLTGVLRDTLIRDAHKAHDVERAVQFFMIFKEQHGYTPQPQTQLQTPQSASNTELSKQVAPGRGRAGASTPPGQKRTYTPVDISKFFDDTKRGVYKGNEKERARIEQDIFLAGREGRIIGR